MEAGFVDRANAKLRLDSKISGVLGGKGIRKELSKLIARDLPPDIDPAAQAAIAEAERLEREAQLRARGRASTVLTSGAGDTSTASTARRVLLGG